METGGRNPHPSRLGVSDIQRIKDHKSNRRNMTLTGFFRNCETLGVSKPQYVDYQTSI